MLQSAQELLQSQATCGYTLAHPMESTRGEQMLRINYWLGLLGCCYCLGLDARELVLAFDNTLRPSTSLDAMARSKMLVRNMANAAVPQAMFLIDAKGVKRRDEARLKLYSDAGHLLVNAGNDGSLVLKADLYGFEVGILKANHLLQGYKGYKRHVHFAYLQEAADSNLQQGLQQFLRNRGYRAAYSSFTPMRGADVYLDQLYQLRLRQNRPVDIVQLERLYVEFVVSSLAAVDARDFLLLGYSPRQVLVLQETDLAAYFIAALVERFEQLGWTIVSAEHAFGDPLFNPIQRNGFMGADYWRGIIGWAGPPVVYPRTLGARKPLVDEFIKARMPQLLSQ
jgi:peptidoglycan-N-acetylglucosamine deacetylase